MRNSGLKLAHLKSRLADRELKLEVSDDAKDYIIEHSYDPVYGARPVKRFIQSSLETLIARSILEDRFAAGDTVRVVTDGTGLKVG